MYRFWSDQNQGHFYTVNENEKNDVINNYDDFVWRFEGVGYYVPNCQIPSTMAVYRFWSDKNQHHFYTINASERDTVINNYDDFIWRFEGQAFCAYDQPIEGAIPVYRFWSDKNQTHFYTISLSERDYVINNYDDFVWRFEGIAYYAF